MLNLFDTDIDDFVSLPSSESSLTSSHDSFVSIPCLSDLLDSHFASVPKNLNVVHINAQSIPAHYPDLLASFEQQNNIHAILVSESWLKPCLSSSSYPLPGFHLIRNDRTGSGGGGVAIYLRAHIPYSIINMSAQPPPSHAGEHLFVEVLLYHTKVLLGVYYSPSSHVNYFATFENLLEDLIPTYSHSIIMGDFNTCIIKKDFRSSKLESIIKSSNMHILPTNATHYFPNSTPSLLDLIIVSSIDHVALHGQCTADAFSYHDLIFLSYKIRPPKAKPKTLLLRNFGNLNLENLRNDASSIDWAPLLNSDSIDDKITTFNSILLKLYDVHAPLKPIKLKHLPAPWLTSDIKLIMHKKDTAKAKYKSRPSDVNKTRYLEARNHCNRVCRDTQRRHISKSVDNEDPAKVWKFLRTLGVGKSRQDSIPHDLDINSLNKHFSSSTGLDRSDKAETMNLLSAVPTPDYTPFVFSKFSDCDVKKSIESIVSNAVGVDGISRNMIVPILDIILPVISHLLNYSVTYGVFPSIWKDAQIIPLPKKLNPRSFSEYRPISILPFLSKVLERLVHNQLSRFLNRNDLLNPHQSGFRPAHSTATALVKITDDIRYGMEKGHLTVLTLLDFSNAFNTVDFDILLELLRSINISSTVVDWFQHYLFGRRQRVHLEDSISSWCTTSAGVPQGGVLSPLLFATFINSISNKLTSSYHLYADDLQIYSQAPLQQLHECIEYINNDLRHIAEWSKAFGLTVNPVKTQVIVIGSSRMISKVDWVNLPKAVFNGVTLPYSKEVKNLGVIIDQTLSWVPQMQAVSRKLFASAGSLKRLRNFLPTATKVMLAQSLLLPILDYADVSYLDLTEDQLNKLERLQNFCIRFIFGLRKYDHVSNFRHKLKWLPIRFRRNTHILSMLYSILFNPLSPRYLMERFNFTHSQHSRSLRSSENLVLHMPPHTSSFYDASFTVESVRLWNRLPVSIRQAKSLQIFKDNVREFYLTQECI